ncbi:MAG: GNAT family N-acetyltransferase [Candidatus Latescibacteria bacterium]|nr:GNAT family N-acetyltransferase [Candidatus Latescibacterota bacterium]
MYEPIDTITLKSGERVEAGVVKGPDPDWAERIEALLEHKSEIWRWGNTMVLRERLDADAYFYILHRGGIPFANMSTVETRGVGIFGHVFTRPEDRRKRAAMELMRVMMDHFRRRGGRALYLGTGYDSHPYHLYRMHGFEGLEPHSGYMDYYSTSKDAFETFYFAKGPAEAAALDWRDWPASTALFSGDFPGVTRCAGMGIFGRQSTESPLLPFIRDASTLRANGKDARAMVLRQRETTAVTGLAMWSFDSLWPRSCVVDVYCHPHFWDRSHDLLGALALPEAERYLAFCDAGFESKAATLSQAGFRPSVTYTRRVARDAARTAFVDVEVWEK